MDVDVVDVVVWNLPSNNNGNGFKCMHVAKSGLTLEEKIEISPIATLIQHMWNYKHFRILVNADAITKFKTWYLFYCELRLRYDQ